MESGDARHDAAGSAAGLAVSVRLERSRARWQYDFRSDGVITGVFGPSGGGKTTLLHLIAGLLTPTAGSIRLGERVLFDDQRRIDRPPHHRRFGVVFQDDRLLPHFSVAGNLRYGAPRRRPHRRFDVDDVVDLLGLRSLLKRRTRNLSGGERQRVALGRALMSEPQLLLLDEPLASLDHQHRREILGLVRRIRDTLPIPMLYVSHDLTELLSLTDRLLIIDGGRSVAHGPLLEVVRQTRAWAVVRDLGPLNLLRLALRGHETEAGLSVFAVTDAAGADGPVLRGPLNDRAVATPLRAAIRGEDIALSLAPITCVSIQNQLPGRVARVTMHPDRAVVEVDIGTTLLVEVSHRTVQQMALAPGVAVHCLIKSNAVRYVDW